VDQVINSKVVDLLFLYNFGKGHRVFFSTICAQIGCQVADFRGASEQCRTAMTKVFTYLRFKSQMPFNMKVVSLDKIHNFCIGKI
jgi:hypothetical protein